MKTAGGRILLRYFGTIALLFSLLSFGLYSSLRRNRRSFRGISTCVATTTVIATSVSKLAFILAHPAFSEVPMKIGVIQ